MHPILSFDHVFKSYKDGDTTLDVLKDIDFSIDKGEFIGLVGPSGAGKSTLLSLAGALLTPSQGQIRLNGKPMAAMTPKEQTALRLESIGFIFQSAHLVPYLNVQEQLIFVSRQLGLPNASAHEKAKALLEKIGLEHRIRHYPSQLSGGERQRVAIARAMINNPDLILADEPTASLDFSRARTIIQWLNSEVKEHEKAALMVTHDSRMLQFCDRVIRLEDGMCTS
ncbi:ABC transporter ATP-binding protein [Sporolactobacillus sp. CPB3-1]|uniref:Putative hemin import ATP-binding protein HrtA n=1 Tax=Sporolactobacillus mangiferae TaxID=2940498 RepID=A0ABT0MD43_9BACL|nr:ABC transporter ATP-binding protein [Sporolactobacillus mangiferae]MCL1632786.1 ABC transporter ATP-binding protein [Sporolactobacillus mangiferae]